MYCKAYLHWGISGWGTPLVYGDVPEATPSLPSGKDKDGKHGGLRERCKDRENARVSISG